MRRTTATHLLEWPTLRINSSFQIIQRHWCHSNWEIRPVAETRNRGTRKGFVGQKSRRNKGPKKQRRSFRADQFEIIEMSLAAAAEAASGFQRKGRPCVRFESWPSFCRTEAFVELNDSLPRTQNTKPTFGWKFWCSCFSLRLKQFQALLKALFLVVFLSF